MDNINPMTSDDIIKLMRSDDYKDRMTAELAELRYRTGRLYDFVTKYDAGALDFTPNVSLYLVKTQLKHMQKYLYCLEVRAKLEGIEI